jgi:hypothetical protein
MDDEWGIQRARVGGGIQRSQREPHLVSEQVVRLVGVVAVFTPCHQAPIRTDLIGNG